MALCGAEGLCLAELVPEGGALSVQTKHKARDNESRRHFAVLLVLRRPTVFRYNREGDGIAGVFNELDDIVVRQLHDGLAVDGRDAVSHLQLP